MPDQPLAVIVPTRGRPQAVHRLMTAWDRTDGFRDANLVFVIDSDDPLVDDYVSAIDGYASVSDMWAVCRADWKPLVPKLNETAVDLAKGPHYALAFMGDDHVPRTRGWARTFLNSLASLKTGIVFGDDGFQGPRLPTHWAMTADMVRALGGMVPAPVDHLYCDNAILDIGTGAGCLNYRPDVLIEHMHPFANKGRMDAGYRRVNDPEQYEKDKAAYERWRSGPMADDIATVRALRG